MPNESNLLKPITLIAYGRSGTSLLSRAFAYHESIEEVGETANLIFTPFRSVDQISGITRFQAENPSSFASEITRFAFRSLYPSDRPEWIQKPIGIPHVFWEFGYRRLPEFVDWYWSAFNRTFPESRTFSVVRHPYDVFLSASNYWTFDVDTIWKTIRVMMEIIASSRSNLKIGVRYENLVSDPEFCMKRICDAVNLNYQSSMLTAFDQLHAPDTTIEFGSAQDLQDKKGRSFSRSSEWRQIEESEESRQAVDAYEKVLRVFDEI